MISHLSFLIQDEITIKKTLCASVKIPTLVFGKIKRDRICIKSVEGTLTSILVFLTSFTDCFTFQVFSAKQNIVEF